MGTKWPQLAPLRTKSPEESPEGQFVKARYEAKRTNHVKSAWVFLSKEASVTTTVDAALIKEQNVTFVVVAVQDHVIHNTNECQKLIAAMSVRFGCPAVLMGGHHHQTRGRKDLVNFLSHVHVSQLPWKKWGIAA